MTQLPIEAFELLGDDKARPVLVYLIQNSAASALKLSYALKMDPDDVDGALQKLEANGLVHREPRQMPGDAYVITGKAQPMRKYLAEGSSRQYRM